MPDPCSALASAASGAIDLAADLTCKEMPMSDLLIVSAWQDTEDKVFATISRTLDIDIPEDCRNATAAGEKTVFRIAPRKLMIVSDKDEIRESLQEMLNEDEAALSQQDHSRVRLRLSGSGAAALLARGAPVDLDEGVFPAGAFAQTAIHHMWVLIHRARPGEEFDLFVLRSFALSLWEWLIESAHIATQTSKGVHSLVG